jgi:hypothetical protein
MADVRIVISKSKKKLYVYRSGQSKPIYTAIAVHGGKGTWSGIRKIKGWHWGAISARYDPNTWFSFGATFKGWPEPGKEGFVTKWTAKWKARRLTANTGEIWYNGEWYPIWKDMNPFGVVMADLTPGMIELHGTGKDRNGKDEFPPVTHGCVRTYNKDIRHIKGLAPIGTEVEIVE